MAEHDQPTSSTHSRPEINDPYAFPQPTLTRLPSISDISLQSEDDIWAPDAATALSALHPPDINMDPEPSGHRRRRSSLMQPLNTSANAKKTRRSPLSATGRRSSMGEDGTTESRPTRPSLEESTSEDLELDNLSEDGLQDDEETGLTGRDKGKRKQQRRRNTLLDNRIAGDSTANVTVEEKKEADRDVLKRSLVNGLLIGLWYLFSLSISIVRPSLAH